MLLGFMVFFTGFYWALYDFDRFLLGFTGFLLAFST